MGSGAPSTRREFIGNSLAVAGVAGLIGPASLTGPVVRSRVSGSVIAFVGDYGNGSVEEARVAEMIHRWDPAAVVTLGDNVYSGENRDAWDILDRKVVSQYRQFIERRRFFPSLGNHDWGDPGTPLLWPDGKGGTEGAWHDVFDLPGNGRYYDVRIGPVHIFVLDDYFREPDGHLVGSTQAAWLKRTAGQSDAPWKVVAHHYPAFVSPASRGKQSIRWPLREWAIDASFAGHWHHYERRVHDGVLYVTSGTGGAPIGFRGPADAVTDRVDASRHAATRVTFSRDEMQIEHIGIDGSVVDDVVYAKGAIAPGVARANPARPAPPPSDVPSQDAPTPPAPEQSEPLRPAPIDELHVGDFYRSRTGSAAALARLYVAAFEREPDRPGFEYWRSSALHVSEIADLMVASVEFRNRYGALSDGEFVERVYLNVLGRTADRNGAAYWTALLRSGLPRNEILLGFSESPEFRARTGIRG